MLDVLFASNKACLRYLGFSIEIRFSDMFAFSPLRFVIDADGRAVLCFDTSRRLDHSPDVRLQLSFFWAQVLSENPLSQTDGYIAVKLVKELKYDNITPRESLVMRTALPIKTMEWHVFECIPNWDERGPIKDFATDFISIFGPLFHFQRDQLHIHTHKEMNEYVHHMESHGIYKGGLPETVGGTWNIQKFMEWISQRTRQDRERFPNQYFIDHVFAQANNTVDNAVMTGLHQMDQAVQQLPQEDKVAYLEAKQRLPWQFWQEECMPQMYLKLKYYNAWLAAKRMCRYWKLRTDCFGPTMRFFPLNQTGEDALDRRALVALQSGFVQLLPPDEGGSSIVWLDGSRLPHGTPREAQEQCLFYMFSLICENEKSQDPGAVMIFKLVGPTIEGIDIDFLKLLANSLALRFKAVHLVGRDEAYEERAKEILTHCEFCEHTSIHLNHSTRALANELAKFGIQRSSLPRFFKGGEWGYSSFVQWQELRTRMEWKIPLCLSGRNDTSHFPAIRAYDLLPDHERGERKRRMNVIHSRRKRDRVRVEEESLNEDYDELVADQEDLILENKRLEQLLKMAEEIVKSKIGERFNDDASVTSTFSSRATIAQQALQKFISGKRQKVEERKPEPFHDARGSGYYSADDGGDLETGDDDSAERKSLESSENLSNTDGKLPAIQHPDGTRQRVSADTLRAAVAASVAPKDEQPKDTQSEA